MNKEVVKRQSIAPLLFSSIFSFVVVAIAGCGATYAGVMGIVHLQAQDRDLTAISVLLGFVPLWIGLSIMATSIKAWVLIKINRIFIPGV